MPPPNFADHPKVINGCSEFVGEVFGTMPVLVPRSAVGMGLFPGEHCCGEIERNLWNFGKGGASLTAQRNRADLPSHGITDKSLGMAWPCPRKVLSQGAPYLPGRVEKEKTSGR